MKYKILYIEDQLAATIKNDLERFGFDVKVNDAGKFEDVLNDLNNTYDAYLMDYNLTADKGRVDASTYASTIRASGGNLKKKPIILISDAKYLSVFKNDFTNQDLFDFVTSKKLFRDFKNKYCLRIKAFIEAYEKIETSKFDVSTILDITNDETINILDYRLLDKLTNFESTQDTYAFSRIINFSLIRSSGLLIGDDILAARLGVDISSSEFNDLLSKIEHCKYTGILSSSYNRWWIHRIMAEWAKISEGKSLRRLKASERVGILNNSYSLNLLEAKPIKLSKSTNYWTICTQTLKPLDPSEGYVISRKDLEDWQEQEYISLYGVLEYPDNKNNLSPIDKQEITEYQRNGTL